MNILSNQKNNFNSLEENTLKKVLELGREIIQEQLRTIDELILKYRDKDILYQKIFKQQQ